MSETERLRYIHSGECMKDLETNGFLTILEQLTLVTQEKVAELSAKPEIKEIGNEIDLEKLFTEASTAIVRSYGLLHSMADSLADSKTIRERVIANADGIMSEEILESLEARVTDIPFQILDTTRIEHFQAFLNVVKEKGSIRVGKIAQLQYIDGKYILRAISGQRIKHQQVDFERNLLAREPRKRAEVIHLW